MISEKKPDYSDRTKYCKKVSYEIKEIDKIKAIELVQENHYSPVMPTLTKHFLGVHKEQDLVGVITLGWGTKPMHTIQKVINKEMTSKDYYEIGKMCMLDEELGNSETQMLSQVVRWLKSNHPDVKYLYTLADGIMGKCGSVYQSANFYYGGEYWTDSYMSAKGEKVHPRTTRQLCFDNWEWHYNSKSPGHIPEFKKTHDVKAAAKRQSYTEALESLIHNIPPELSEEKASQIRQFSADFYESRSKYIRAYDEFVSSKAAFSQRPVEKSFLPSVPKGLSEYLSNPKKDYIKKQQVFWLTPEYMKHIGLRKIKGKMFRYIYPLSKSAKKLLKKSEQIEWKIGSGVYPKENNGVLQWKEMMGRNDYQILEEMPAWDLQVTEHNEKNVNAHKSK